MLSILIPVYNEEQAIEETIRSLCRAMAGSGEPFEVVAVNDGSRDRTGDILGKLSKEMAQLKVLTHPENRGYSASLKTGIRHSTGDCIGMVDADGTYPIAEFPALLADMKAAAADMVVGARTKLGAEIPLIRRPAKAIVNWLARILTGIRIPDINSGMRIFTRKLGEQFMHLYPQRFSFTITITLAALTNDYLVLFHPIDYYARKGKSTITGVNGVWTFLSFLALIVRMVTYFRPLRFFVWPSLVLLLGGGGLMTYTVFWQANISDSGLLLFLSGLQIGLFGLVAEAVVRSRVPR